MKISEVMEITRLTKKAVSLVNYFPEEQSCHRLMP
jgi:hypothetical protein